MISSQVEMDMPISSYDRSHEEIHVSISTWLEISLAGRLPRANNSWLHNCRESPGLHSFTAICTHKVCCYGPIAMSSTNVSESAPPEGEVRKILCDDVSDGFENIRDRLGREWTDLEIYNWCETMFLCGKGVTVRCTTKNGEYAWAHHPQNMTRRDAGGTDAKTTGVHFVATDIHSPQTQCEV